MPEQEYWESLFDVEAILDALSVDAGVNDAVEVGCGYGTFTAPVARRIRGTVHSVDIEPSMIAQTRARLASAGVKNVNLYEHDVIAHGFPVPAGSVDAVLLFNILHAENPIELLRTSAGLLRPAGRVLVIHWRSDITTPRGPDLSVRPRPEHVMEWAQRTAMLVPVGAPSILPPWHFGVTLQRIG